MQKNYSAAVSGLRRVVRSSVREARLVPGRLRFSKQTAVIDRVVADKRTYLEPLALLDLVSRVSGVENGKKEGILIEAGCALGGSAVVIASAKKPQRRFRVYDTFGLIPPPSGTDGDDVRARYEEIRSGNAVGIDGDSYYGYRTDLYSEVRDSFRSYGYPIESNSVDLVQGLFDETLMGSEPVAFAHIDCDWYESVTTCLTRIVPRLVPGATIVFDDYDHWSGCRRAVDDFFRDERSGFDFARFQRLHVTRR